MKTPILTFFNNKGGVGKTSLVYHLSWMFSMLGKKVIVVDLDSQANLTAAFLNEDKIEKLWDETSSGTTMHRCVKPLAGIGDIKPPVLEKVEENLYLLPGDVALSGFEETLSSAWSISLGDNNLYRPMRILSCFWQVTQMAVKQHKPDLILTDIGPHLGAINRSVLLATDFVAIPLGADLFSLQGLKNLGPILASWRKNWKKRLENWIENSEKHEYPEFKLPEGEMKQIGYLCQQHGVRLDRPVIAYDKWVKRIPNTYRKCILDKPEEENLSPEQDLNCLATIKHYRSLVPMAQEHRKPIFHLTPADGAIGSHSRAAQDAKKDFKELARKIGARINIKI